MRTNSKSSQEWQIQNDSKPLWTKSPREVCTAESLFPVGFLSNFNQTLSSGVQSVYTCSFVNPKTVN